nr:glycosyltransferase [Quadrisphaera sp. RL12-1S]
MPRDGKFLLVASTGGHLAQLNIIAELLGAGPDSHWVTFQNHQSRSLVGDRPHTYVEYIGPRQFRKTIKAIPDLSKVIRSRQWDAVISTGAAIAVPALGIGASMGLPAYYIESVSRLDGPSLTGKIMAKLPGVQTFTQHQTWSSKRWPYELSVFDKFHPKVIDIRDKTLSETQPQRIFVTLGTIQPYRFDSLIDAVCASTVAKSADITWQLGCSERPDLPGHPLRELSQADFAERSLEADLVVTHAGVATCLQLVAAGIHPIVVPRRMSRHEHVDDHQQQIAKELARRKLCTYVEVDDLEGAIARALAAQR